jgi:hypothetical protein
MAQRPASELYVSPAGSDAAPGSRERPFATPARALAAARDVAGAGAGAIQLWLRAGSYALPRPLLLEAGVWSSPDVSLTIAAFPGELATLSGGRRLACDWRPYRDGIYQCDLPEAAGGHLDFDQLFINGQRQVRARYPNQDLSDPKHFTGYLPAVGELEAEIVDPLPGPDDDMTFAGGAPRGVRFDPARLTPRAWARPREAIIHIYQSHYWGNLQWRLKHVDWEAGILWFGEGGQQMGAKWHADPCRVDQRSRFYVENVFEELDAPGEWYLDREAGRLYFLPPAGVDLGTALVEVPQLARVVQLIGAPGRPVMNVTLEGLRLAHTGATFLEPYSVPSLSDWAIHRGGAVYFSGTRQCAVKDCFFDAVGGNAVFLDGYNRGATVSGCRFTEAGDSAVCMVGSLENTVGTQRNFPYECRAENNLVHDCGVFGKQSAGIYLSRAKRITVAHNEIYDMPRAGICIGDGTWGGHVVEYNHIHNTCRETGDHGPFNAWGRDRYWCLVQSHTDLSGARAHSAGNVHIDAQEPVIVRQNIFEEQAGWGLDMDDGASNYDIYNNLCVGVSVKLREGAYRTIHNNIWINGANSPCFHVGNTGNHDRYFQNITVMSVAHTQPEMDLDFDMGNAYGEIYTLIAPPEDGPWLEEIDRNCFTSDLGYFVARVRRRGERQGRKYTLEEWQALGFDRLSVFADPCFVDAAHGNYRLRPESPALGLGFQNFNMEHCGLTAGFPERWREARSANPPSFTHEDNDADHGST